MVYAKNQSGVHRCSDCGAALTKFYPLAEQDAPIRAEGPVFGGHGYFKCLADCHKTKKVEVHYG